jgi:hypothetical protein
VIGAGRDEHNFCSCAPCRLHIRCQFLVIVSLSACIEEWLQPLALKSGGRHEEGCGYGEVRCNRFRLPAWGLYGRLVVLCGFRWDVSTVGCIPLRLLVTARRRVGVWGGCGTALCSMFGAWHGKVSQVEKVLAVCCVTLCKGCWVIRQVLSVAACKACRCGDCSPNTSWDLERWIYGHSGSVFLFLPSYWCPAINWALVLCSRCEAASICRVLK